MKKCKKCDTVRPKTDFAIDNSTKDKLATCCKVCHKEWGKINYQLNKEKVGARLIAKRKRVKEYVNNLKRKTGCQNCAENEPVCLDYHHTNPENKIERVSYIARCSTSFNKINQEIEKCVLLCANCHRKLHYKKEEKNESIGKAQSSGSNSKSNV